MSIDKKAVGRAAYHLGTHNGTSARLSASPAPAARTSRSLSLSALDALQAPLNGQRDDNQLDATQVGCVPCVALSAAKGGGVDSLLPAAAALYSKWTQRVSTARLNRWLGRVALRNPTGALARIRYITQVLYPPHHPSAE